MSDVIQVDDNNFETEVLQATVPVLVDFGAAWCGPCVRQLPIIEKFAAENAAYKVCKVDIDDASAMAAKFGIKSVPTLMIFSGGASLGSKVGLSSLADISSFMLVKTGS